MYDSLVSLELDRGMDPHTVRHDGLIYEYGEAVHPSLHKHGHVHGATWDDVRRIATGCTRRSYFHKSLYWEAPQEPSKRQS